MDKSIIKILSVIEDNGFEAYVVGGYVRDFLLGKDTKDIDVCTNAKVVELVDIFNDFNIVSNNYGAVKFTYNDYKFDITTYREDVKYNGDRRSLEIKYVDNLVEDIKRRDFTCNTLCMNKEGNIIDILNGTKDINDKIIRCVGNIKEKMEEDPLRILRAIRFATVLDFKIEEDLYEFIKDNKSLVDGLSTTRIKEELSKILVSKRVKKGLDYLKRLQLTQYMGIDFENIIVVSDICGMYSQMSFSKEYPFTIKEKESMDSIRKLVNRGKIDKYSIIEYGLYTCSVAGDILGYKKREIINMEKSLAIKSRKDIAITGDEICKLLDIEPSKVIGMVIEEVFVQVVEGNVKNDKMDIVKYILNNRRKWVNGETRSSEERE